MAFDSAPSERSAWISLVVAGVGYPVYLVVLVAGSPGPALADAPFVWPMVGVVGASIVATMILQGVFRGHTDRESREQDERDILIDRWAERIGGSFVALGALGGLVLLMLDTPRFWPANVIFLGFFLSAILSSIAKIVAYRGRFSPTW